jgi:hypothetical protein
VPLVESEIVVAEAPPALYGTDWLTALAVGAFGFTVNE